MDMNWRTTSPGDSGGWAGGTEDGGSSEGSGPEGSGGISGDRDCCGAAGGGEGASVRMMMMTTPEMLSTVIPRTDDSWLMLAERNQETVDCANAYVGMAILVLMITLGRELS